MDPNAVRDAFMRARPAVRDLWQARWIAACSELGRADRIFLLMLLCAIEPKASGGPRAPRLGENAIIKAPPGKRPELWTQYTDAGNRNRGPCRICTVDQLNHHLGWMMQAIDATDLEYRAIVDKVATWISRDETQLGLTVDRQVATTEEQRNIDLAPVIDELKEKGKL